MKQFTKIPIILIVLTCTLWIFGCSKLDRTSGYLKAEHMVFASEKPVKISLTEDDFTVPIETVSQIAKSLNKINLGKISISKKKDALSIEKSISIMDSIGSPNMYVFNFKGDGFAVFSADKRYFPLLAVVPKGKYEPREAPGGLIDWFNVTMDHINLAKFGKNVSTLSAQSAWSKMVYDVNEINGLKSSIMPTGDCGTTTYTVVGPYLQTEWGQGCGYNDSLTSIITGLQNCTKYWCNSNPPTGCVATAIAQIIRFWEVPTLKNYNYYGMPNRDNYYIGNTEIHRLAKDAGISVNMQWGCTSSGAYMNDVPNAMKSYFGFTNSNHSSTPSNFLNLITSNLQYGYPVILGGCATRSWVPFKYKYYDCHAWVCDGFQKLVNNCYTYYYYRMNWGWEGFGDGWFGYDNWNSPNGNFKYAQELIYNVTP